MSYLAAQSRSFLIGQATEEVDVRGAIGANSVVVDIKDIYESRNAALEPTYNESV